MFDYKLERVEKILHRLYRRNFFDGKRLYLFGVSENTRQIIRILRTCHLEPSYILDNDKLKQGTYCSEVRVIPVEAVEELRNPLNIYILCSFYEGEMRAQLEAQGVPRKNIVALFEKGSLLKCFCHAWLGKRIYDRLIARYGGIPVFVCPYTGTGDIYLIGTFWKQYIERNHIEDYVFLVISRACEKTARLFDIKNLTVFHKKVECSYLIQYYMLCPGKVNLVLLNDSWPQLPTNYLEWFRGYKGLDFAEMFRKFVFALPDTARPERPVFKNVEGELEKLFQEHQLQEGKTVVLSPYSNTLADLPKGFWAALAEALKQAGFTVCTNSGGPEEEAIEGTRAVFFPLDIAPQFIERAGYFVGIRSGFCDVVSGAGAKKILLYQKRERFFQGSTYEYFSLKKMGLCGDAVEIQFEAGDQELLKEVLGNIIKGGMYGKQKVMCPSDQ